MSNFLAIATVTATLQQILQEAVDANVPGAVSGAQVTMFRPDKSGPMSGIPDRGVNIFLYQVTTNGFLSNADLPTRRPDGQLVQRPRAALDLHYLLTFYGTESDLEPQRLAGIVVRTLHARPLLTRQKIQDTVANVTFPFLATSNLADEVELAKFTMMPLSLEELSKLWSVFFQIQYSLAVAYECSVVLVEDEVSTQSALPVRARNIYVTPFRQPAIEQVVSQAGADQPIVADSTLFILGKQLSADVTSVRLAGMDVTPLSVNDTQVTVSLASLAASALRAGAQGIQVVHQMLLGTPPLPHRGIESNVAAFVLRPSIQKNLITGDYEIAVSNVQVNVDGTRNADVAVKFDPEVGKTQRVLLLLNEFNPPSNRPARAYSFEAPSRNQPASPESTADITFSIAGVQPGAYLVRVQVDGAQSVLEVDGGGQYNLPQVTIP